MHHISAERRYISLREPQRASLQWADSSERIHFSLRTNPKVSFTEELQTSELQLHAKGYKGYGGKGHTGPDSEHHFGFGLTDEPNGGKNLIAKLSELQRIFDLLPWMVWFWIKMDLDLIISDLEYSKKTNCQKLSMKICNLKWCFNRRKSYV